MAGSFQTPITIKEAVHKIHSREFLVPAIQRKFVWSSWQIEMLFDSLLRGYPINSFMLWKISEPTIKSSYKFYELIKEYRQMFAENNPYVNTTGMPDFYAIIDGQQRLTSLYIGLLGSYAYKLPRKRWNNTQDSIPTRRLYLNLSEQEEQQYDNQKLFDFEFLIDSDVNTSKDTWFEVRKILDLDSLNKVNRELNARGLSGNVYAEDTLIRLYETVHADRLINYYLQDEQDADKVLEIFIRANSGGTPLSFSDLLMSIASANWADIDARAEFDRLINEVYGIGRAGFRISKDFILKTCLVLFADNIKFQLKNFTFQNVRQFEVNWKKIRAGIMAAFTLFDQLGFNDKTFRAKNAAIPVIYHIYWKDISDSIIKQSYSNEEEKKNITKWLIMTFLKSVFSGHTDSVLVAMRNVLKESSGVNFPAKELANIFKNDPAKNYTFDDEVIDGLMKAQKDSNEAFYVLHLIYSNLDYMNQNFHLDHMHPASIFTDRIKLTSNIPQSDWEFAENPENWNSVANLQLLGGNFNSSKNDAMLEDWVKEHRITKRELLVDDNTSLNIADFRAFIEERRKNLRKYIKEIISF